MVALREVSTSSSGRSPATSRAASIRFPMKALRRRQLLALSLRKCRCSWVRGPTFSESSSLLKPAITVIGVRSSWLTTVSSSSRSPALRSRRACSSSSSRFARSRWWLSRWTSASDGSKLGQVLDLPPALSWGLASAQGAHRHRQRVFLPTQQPAFDDASRQAARDPVGNTGSPRPSPGCRGPGPPGRWTPSLRPARPASHSSRRSGRRSPFSRPTERASAMRRGHLAARPGALTDSPGFAMLSPDRAVTPTRHTLRGIVIRQTKCAG